MIDFQRPRKQSNPEDSLIPLINIVFLLLIFFMVAFCRTRKSWGQNGVRQFGDFVN